MEQPKQPYEQVNSPAHYNKGRIECIDYLEDQFASRPHEWTAVTYITRAGQKPGADELTDLEKAQYYLNRKIRLLKRLRIDASEAAEKEKLELAATKEKQELADQAERDARKKARTKAKIKAKAKQKKRRR